MLLPQRALITRVPESRLNNFFTEIILHQRFLNDTFAIIGVVSENGIYGHSRFCNTDFDDKLACLNLSGV